MAWWATLSEWALTKLGSWVSGKLTERKAVEPRALQPSIRLAAPKLPPPIDLKARLAEMQAKSGWSEDLRATPIPPKDPES